MKSIEQNTLVKQEMGEIQQFICELCGFSFSNETYLANHYNFCKYVKNQNDRLGVNTRNILEKRMSLTEQNTLVKQEIEPCEKLPEIQQYICELCSFTFSNETYLANHYNLCKDMMNQNDRLGVNTRNIREKKMSLTEQNTLVKQEIVPCEKLPEIQQRICEFCGFTFSNETYLANHYNLCKDMMNQNDRLGVNTRNILEKRMSLTEQNTLVKQEIGPCEELPEIQQCICEFCGFTFSNETYLANHYNFCKYVKNQNDRLGVNTTIVKKELCEDEEMRNSEAPNKNIKDEPMFDINIDFDLESIELPTTKTLVKSRKAKKCTICGYSTLRADNLRRHMNTHTVQKQFKCTICNFSASRSDSLRHHMIRHKVTGKKELFERDIPKLEASDENMKAKPMYDINIDLDLRSIEPSTTETLVKSGKAKKCTVCDYSTLRSDNLQRHINKRHPEVNPIKCTICNYATAQPGNLEVHMKSHTVTVTKALREEDVQNLEAPDENGKAKKAKPMSDINVKKSIKRSRTETSVKTNKAFKCTVCDFSTDRSDNLKRHMKRHTVTVERELYERDVPNLVAPDKNIKPKPMSDINVDMDLESIEPSTTETLVKSGKAQKCTFCDYSTLRSDNLKRHMIRQHTGVKSELSTGRRQHRAKPRKPNTFDCKYCDYTTTQRQLKRHISSHKKGNPFKCRICDYTTVEFGHFKVHTLTHAVEKKFKCTICKYSTASSQNLKRHMLRHTGEKAFKCTICDYSSMYSIGLKYHMAKHTGLKPLKCTECDYSTTRLGQLNNHISRHKGVKPYKCTICDHTTVDFGHLKLHMLTHTGERPYKCTICNYSCSQSGNLKIHMRKHTGERPFKCSICEYSARQLQSLKNHIKTHTGEKAFKCTICDYSAPFPEAIKRHMVTHTGEKAHKCTICGMSFTQSGSVKRHMLLRHASKE